MQIQNLAERLATEPVTYARTLRPDVVRTVTSWRPGYAVPLAFIPMLREDGLETSQVQLRAYMDETADLLLNSVNAVFSAWFVPKLAFDRFGASMDALNRAYMGQPEIDGSQIEWIKRQALGNASTAANLYRAAGLHSAESTDLVNTDYAEAYYKVFEYRCRQRSEALWEAVKGTIPFGSLCPAFFDNPQMAMVKASFDTQAIDGDVPLTFANSKIPIKGIGKTTMGFTPDVGPVYESDGSQRTYAFGSAVENANALKIEGTAADGIPAIFAELAGNGITVSLSNIDLAKETQAWAAVRNRYSGLDDDDLIDLLMAGVAVPSQYMAKPMMMGRQVVPFGMVQRYSSDADALQVSATRGVAGTTMALRLPPMNTGGVIVVQAEVVPEQFWERSADYHLLATNSTRRPDRLLDQLDPQAVEVVENSHADVAHSDPTGIFGYAPLNHEYVRRRFNMGGKFYKPDPNAAWNEDRNRIWTSEPIDPTLSREFYLAEDLPQEVFLDTTADNFEFSMAADFRISGLTYIGPMLREATDDYESILSRVDQSRISGTPVAQVASDKQDETGGDVVAPETTEDGTDNE